MNDPRDFLAFAQYGNLAVLLLGVGLLGVLIHPRPIRKWLSVGVGLLGILLLGEGGAMFHGATTYMRNSAVVALLTVLACVVGFHSVHSTETTEE